MILIDSAMSGIVESAYEITLPSCHPVRFCLEAPSPVHENPLAVRGHPLVVCAHACQPIDPKPTSRHQKIVISGPDNPTFDTNSLVRALPEIAIGSEKSQIVAPRHKVEPKGFVDYGKCAVGDDVHNHSASRTTVRKGVSGSFSPPWTIYHIENSLRKLRPCQLNVIPVDSKEGIGPRTRGTKELFMDVTANHTPSREVHGKAKCL